MIAQQTIGIYSPASLSYPRHSRCIGADYARVALARRSYQAR
jgi:hypothetical protein